MSRCAYFVAAVVAAGTLGGCTSTETLAGEHVRFGALAFDVPAGWQRDDRVRRGVATAEWRPDGNDRKESLTVIRTDMTPALAKAGATALVPYLAAAQRSLPRARASRVQPVVTTRGFEGARIDVQFVPAGQQEPYRRVHVVLVDGSALVHVLYTARHYERDLDPVAMVLEKIGKEGA